MTAAQAPKACKAQHHPALPRDGGCEQGRRPIGKPGQEDLDVYGAGCGHHRHLRRHHGYPEPLPTLRA